MFAIEIGHRGARVFGLFAPRDSSAKCRAFTHWVDGTVQTFREFAETSHIGDMIMTKPSVPRKKAAAFRDAEPVGPKDAAVQVREAGPDATRSHPRDWDDVDEAVDESFPASDPPAKY